MAGRARPWLPVLAGVLAATALAAAAVGGLSAGHSTCMEAAVATRGGPAPAPGTLRSGWLCLTPQDCQPAWYLEGLLPHGDPQAHLASFDTLWQRSAGQAPRWLCLSSPGGSVETARAVAQWTRERGLGTCVVPIATPPDGTSTDATGTAPPTSPPATASTGPADPALVGKGCASACVEVWLAGRDRVLHPELALGLHQSQMLDHPACRWQNLGGLLDDAGQAYRQAWAHGDWRLRWVLLRAALATPAQQAQWFTGRELAERTLVPPASVPEQARWHAQRPGS